MLKDLVGLTYVEVIDIICAEEKGMDRYDVMDEIDGIISGATCFLKDGPWRAHELLVHVFDHVEAHWVII